MVTNGRLAERCVVKNEDLYIFAVILLTPCSGSFLGTN